jgi:hypothetical protein
MVGYVDPSLVMLIRNQRARRSSSWLLQVYPLSFLGLAQLS